MQASSLSSLCGTFFERTRNSEIPVRLPCYMSFPVRPAYYRPKVRTVLEERRRSEIHAVGIWVQANSKLEPIWF